MTPMRALTKPMGSIIKPPIMKPRWAVRTSLAPKEIWIMLCSERLTVTRTTIR